MHVTYGIGLFTEIVFQSAVVFLFAGSVVSILYGAALFLGKEWALKANVRLNRWTSTRQMMRTLDLPLDVEPQLQRWHQFAGVFLVVASAYVLHAVIVGHSANAIASAYHAMAPLGIVETVFSVLWWVLALASGCGCILGLILVFRPRLLQSVEAWSRRSFSARHATKYLERVNNAPDQLIASYPKASGVLIVLGGLYVALMLGSALLYRG